MTEDEAKTKWCPFARVGHSASGLGSMNRIVNDDASDAAKAATLCQASACMAWRRQRSEMDNDGYVNEAPPGSGFCGLAGAPQ